MTPAIPACRTALVLASIGLLASGAFAHWPPLGAGRQGCTKARLLSQGVTVSGGGSPDEPANPCVLGYLDLVNILSKLVIGRPGHGTPIAAPSDGSFATAVNLTPHVWDDPIEGSGSFGFWGEAMAWNVPSPGYQLLVSASYDEAFFCDIASTMYFETVSAMPGAIARVSIKAVSGAEIAVKEFAMDGSGAQLSFASPGNYRFGIEVEWRTPELPLGDTVLAVPTIALHAHLAAGAGCPADLNVDQVVEDGDFVQFASAYDLLDCIDPAMALGCPADLNRDGLVEDADFVLFAEAYDLLECQ